VNHGRRPGAPTRPSAPQASPGPVPEAREPPPGALVPALRRVVPDEPGTRGAGEERLDFADVASLTAATLALLVRPHQGCGP
jgi:hypothetical protein